MTDLKYGDVSVRMDGHVALIEIHRPPHNYFDAQLIQDLAEAFEAMDSDHDCRAIVLASEGKSFCAGANFNAAFAKRGVTAEAHLLDIDTSGRFIDQS